MSCLAQLVAQQCEFLEALASGELGEEGMDNATAQSVEAINNRLQQMTSLTTAEAASSIRLLIGSPHIKSVRRSELIRGMNKLVSNVYVNQSMNARQPNQTCLHLHRFLSDNIGLSWALATCRGS